MDVTMTTATSQDTKDSLGQHIADQATNNSLGGYPRGRTGQAESPSHRQTRHDIERRQVGD